MSRLTVTNVETTNIETQNIKFDSDTTAFTINSSGVISSGSHGLGGVGIGQTWTDVTSSRNVGTVYTNSTGKPIFCVFIGTTGTSAGCNWEIGGVAGPQQTYTNSSNGRSEISAIVPDGVTYEVNGNATKQTWIELR